jgi:hypothetical protein
MNDGRDQWFTKAGLPDGAITGSPEESPDPPSGPHRKRRGTPHFSPKRSGTKRAAPAGHERMPALPEEPSPLDGHDGLPILVVQDSDLPATAHRLRDLFAESGHLFERGMVVRVGQPSAGGLPSIQRLSAHAVVMEAHAISRPVKKQPDGSAMPVTLPERLANLYLSMSGEWNLPPLDGVAAGPVLSDGGEIAGREGYDPQTRLWCLRTPPCDVPAQPLREDAEWALSVLRSAFATFPFEDSPRAINTSSGAQVVDERFPPGLDESALLCGLLTAIARPSLPLAPGLIVTAAAVSGSGSGKGLLVRSIAEIAYGIPPRAFTAGGDRHELDKRLASELVEAAPVLFLDNVNGTALRSDLLASVLTERPARVRILGKTEMVPLNSTAFIAVTGNGLSVSEDLARRFLMCRLDAQTEDPESRPFAPGFLDGIRRHRGELMSAALTIWRWGRQNQGELIRGQPSGSFEQWSIWVRDPLITLGCADPMVRVAHAKQNDPHRMRIADLFRVWHGRHGSLPMRASELADEVIEIADPQKRGRQFQASFFDRLTGTRMSGFVLTSERGGRWSAATYALMPTTTE